jgi:replicative DNA helicase
MNNTPEKLAQLEENLASYEGDDKVISSADMQKLIDEQPDATVNFKSGFTALDALIEGFEGGELIVVSGPTKMGKTTWCQTLTKHFADQDIRSLWFSYEMPAKQFLRKFGDNPPLFYLPQELKGRILPWIENRIWEAKLKYEVKAVFIDHLHFLVDLAKLRNPSLEIGAIVRGIKRIAMEHNVVIFLIAHLAKIRTDQEPSVSDLRDSSFIGQDSDSVIIIQRQKSTLQGSEGEYSNQAKVSVQTHRRTGVMGKSVLMLLQNNFFVEEVEADMDIRSPEPRLDL